MILRFIRMNILTITVTIRRIIISYNVNIGLIIVERSIGHTAAAIPSTNSMLNILEPTTLPTARSFSPFFDATMDVTSSGSDVPKATIVSPIRVSVIPSERAISVALSTTKSPPSAIAVSPAIIKETFRYGYFIPSVRIIIFKQFFSVFQCIINENCKI